MSSHRLLRVRELLKRQIGEAIRREISVQQAGLITVNDVEVASDIKAATVFVSVIGTEEQKRNALSVLHKNRVRLQGLLAKNVILKYTPRLRFKMDDAVARGDQVLAIIAELEKESSPRE